MLVLARKTGEDIIIEVGGEIITVMVVQCDRGKTRLGFTAPQHVRINRREVYDDIKSGVPQRHKPIPQ